MRLFLLGAILLISTILYSSQRDKFTMNEYTELGYIDGVTINDREFDDIEDHAITFYEEDLIDGNVIIEGIFEDNDRDDIPQSELVVKLSYDGGNSWNNVNLNGNDWSYSFTPDTGEEYSLSVKIFPKIVDINTTEDKQEEQANNQQSQTPHESYQISGFELHINTSNSTIIANKLSGTGYIDIPWLPNAKKRINVTFHDLDINLRQTAILSGDITVNLTVPINLIKSDITLKINKLRFSSSSNIAKLSGFVQTSTEDYLKELGSLNFFNATFTTSGINTNIISNNAISTDIYQDKNVKIKTTKTVAKLKFNKKTASLKLEALTAQIDFGTLFPSVEPFDITYDKANKRIRVLYTGSIDYHSAKISNLNGYYELHSKDLIFGGKLKLPNNALLKKSLGLNFTNFRINKDGFNGNISGTLNETFAIVHSSVDAKLKTARISVTSSSPYVKVEDVSADLIFKQIFSNGMDTVSLAKVGKKYTWALPGIKSFPGFSKGKFKDIRGEISSDSLSDLSALKLSATFWHEDFKEHKISVLNAQIKSDGFYGRVYYSNGNKDLFGIENLRLKNISLSFAANALDGNGAATLKYHKNRFLESDKNLIMEIGAIISQNNVTYHSTVENIPIKIDQFADININRVGINGGRNNDFKINLAGLIKPTNKTFKFANSVSFSGLQISKHGVKFNGGIEAILNVEASGKLGGLDLSVEKIILGYKSSKFYIGAKGMLALKIASAGAGVKLFSDKSLEVDSINIQVNQPALTFGGEITWYKNDNIYGNGFGTISPLRLSIANAFSLKGAFKIGIKKDKGFYWMAKAQGGVAGGIPLGPVTMYEVGGGIAYNMRFVTNQNNVSLSHFEPNGSQNINLILSSLIGTPDTGYTWHGQFDIMFDSDGQIILQGDSYLLSTLQATPSDRRISANIIMGFAPSSLHLIADADIKYNGIEAKGGLDLLLNPTQQHIYIGSKDIRGFDIDNSIGPVSVKFIQEFQGYFMLNRRQLAFGGGISMDKEIRLNWWGPDPWSRLYFEYGMDALIQYKPFFMDAGAYADFMLSAGYGSITFAKLSAGVSMNFRAPNPTYIKVKAYMDLPRNIGRVSFTTYLPRKPRDTSPPVPNLISNITPEYEKDVSFYPNLSIQTAFPATINYEPIGNFVRAYTNGRTYQFKLSDVKLKDITSNQYVALTSKTIDRRNFKFITNTLLKPNHNYKFSAIATLKNSSGRVIKTSTVIKNFKTKTNLGVLDIIKKVTPGNFEKMYSSWSIKVYYKDIVKKFGINNNTIKNAYSLKVINTQGEEVDGNWRYNSQYAYSQFYPTTPLGQYYYCVDKDTGEIRKTFKNEDGNFLNPFTDLGIEDTLEEDNSNNIHSANNPNNITSFGGSTERFRGIGGGGRYYYYVNNQYSTVIKNKANETVITSSVLMHDETKNGIVNTILGDINPTITFYRNRNNRKKMKFIISNGLNGDKAYSIIDLKLKTYDGSDGIKQFILSKSQNIKEFEEEFPVAIFLNQATIKYKVDGQLIRTSYLEMINGGNYSNAGTGKSQNDRRSTRQRRGRR